MADQNWPVPLAGVTESIVTTLGPNDRWNIAALGVTAPDGDGPATARTWGRTRTRRNFDARGGGYIQFTRDPVEFVNAALSVYERDEPIGDDVDAWVRVTVERLGSGSKGDTEWVDWALIPEESDIEQETVPVFNRGYAAVVEATVAASRLDVPAYDTETLRERIDYFDSVVDSCGRESDREAFDRLLELTFDE
jgi:hypothetical protein